MELIDYLRLARELTASSDVKELMLAAKYLQAEMETTTQPEATQESTSWRDVRGAADFVHQVKILHPVKGSIPFKPYAFQHALAMALDATSKRLVLINSARQMGISTVLAALAVYRAATSPNHTVMTLANSLSSAIEVMSRIRYMIETSELPLPFVTHFNKSSIEFNNGSRIIARAVGENAHRGMCVGTIMVHDAAYIAWSKEESWWNSILPSLGATGQLIMASSPNMEKGLFYDLWEKDNDDALKLMITWRDHPERDEAWADIFRKQLGADKFAREYEGKFLPYLETKM